MDDTFSNSSFSSPTITILGTSDIQSVFERIEQCGEEKITIVSSTGSELKEIAKYCDNRVCSNPNCRIHREYQYRKYHKSQIALLNKTIKSPKAWIFTGWVFPYPIDRDFCRKKLRNLFDLLKNRKVGSVTEFSIHMEVKLRSNDWYLHFHVVLGGLVDMRLMQKKAYWGRYVKYQYPISQEGLADYISKYSAKTPFFRNFEQRLDYFQYIYKTQTSRFSCGRSGYSPSGWHLYSRLEWEAYKTLKRAYPSNGYCPFIVRYDKRSLDKPPPLTLFDYDLDTKK